MGPVGNSSAVVVIDVRSGATLDWFYCIAPRRIASRWLVYVEFYLDRSYVDFNHVVLAYDLHSDPIGNRIGDARAERIPAAPTEVPQRVGLPLFPSRNVQERSYENLAQDRLSSVRVLVHAGFAFDGQRLAFIACQGEVFPTSWNTLAVIDVSTGLHRPHVSTVPIPRHVLKEPGENPNFIKVDKIESVAPDVVRLFVPKTEYGIASFTVNLLTGAAAADDTEDKEQHLEIPPGLKYIRRPEAVAAATLVSTPEPPTVPGSDAVVVFEALIDENGKVQKLLLVSGPPELVSVAEQILRQRVYLPTFLDGTPVAVLTILTVKFPGKLTGQGLGP
jgi:hypothetical protein